MCLKNVIAPISAERTHHSKQNIEQATTAIPGITAYQTKPALLTTEAFIIKLRYFLLCCSVNLESPQCFSTRIQHHRAALASVLSC